MTEHIGGDNSIVSTAARIRCCCITQDLGFWNIGSSPMTAARLCTGLLTRDTQLCEAFASLSAWNIASRPNPQQFEKESGFTGGITLTESEAYHVLGLPENAGPEHIRTRYRELIVQVHPDKMRRRSSQSSDQPCRGCRIKNDPKDSLLWIIFPYIDGKGCRTAGTDSPYLPEAYDALTAFLRVEIAAGFRRVQK